jgi:hypothetical protein
LIQLDATRPHPSKLDPRCLPQTSPAAFCQQSSIPSERPWRNGNAGRLAWCPRRSEGMPWTITRRWGFGINGIDAPS